MNKNAIRWWVVLGVVLVVYNVLAFALPFPKKAVDVFFPPEAQNDFPVAMQV